MGKEGEKREKKNGGPVLLLLFTLLAHVGALRCGFVWDDGSLVVQNPGIRSLAEPGRFFDRPLYRHSEAEMAQRNEAWSDFAYRPLVLVSWAVDHALFGLRAAAFHGTNLFLHLLTVLLLHGMLGELTGEGTLAFLAAALFAVHPALTEAVTWVSGRGDLLGAVFLLLAMRLFGPLARREGGGGALLSIAVTGLLMLGAMLSKESWVVAPLLLVVVWAGRLPGRLLLARLVPAGLAAAAAWAFLRHAAGVGAFVPLSGLSVTERLAPVLRAFRSLWAYGATLVWPHPLRVKHGPLGPFLRLEGLDWAALVGGLVLFVLVLRVDGPRRLATRGLAGFALALAPVLDLVPGTVGRVPFAERYLYGPAMFFFLVPLAVLPRLPSARARRGAVMAVLAVVLCFGGLTLRRVPAWRSSLTLWQAEWAAAPGDVEVATNLAAALQEAGRGAEALAMSRRAVAGAPEDGRAWSTHLAVAVEAGADEEIRRAWAALRRLAPDLLSPRVNMAIHRYRRGDPAGALVLAEEAARLKPGRPSVENARGMALAALGRGAEAREAFRAAVAGRPTYGEAWLRLAGVAESLGRLDEAEEALRRARVLMPERAEPMVNLASFLMRRRRHAEADAVWARLVETCGDYARDGLRGRARCALARGDEAAARAHLERSNRFAEAPLSWEDFVAATGGGGGSAGKKF